MLSLSAGVLDLGSVTDLALLLVFDKASWITADVFTSDGEILTS